ncbi:MAG: carboxylesterase family protein [Alphaproteobacteria bacterium]|nr:carboxylesterase family protein [Alphaproteobacteria bacterium]
MKVLWRATPALLLVIATLVGCEMSGVPASARETRVADSGLGTLVETEGGHVMGLNGAVRTYKGIPYAAPPVGELRWKPPQPVNPWDGVKVATVFGPGCIPGTATGPSFSENCLSLNVWTPARAAGEKRPVLVWIHGGGFENGVSSSTSSSGDALALEGVVVVSINYRLGVFGFFAHPELSAESVKQVSGNQGLLDMIAALGWVNRNIAAFGGDPTNVTIMGESAGGTAVGLLMLTPASEGLFQKVVASSPWGFLQPTRHLRRHVYGRPSAESAGAALGDLASLRARSSAEMQLAQRDKGVQGHYIVDGVVLPDDLTTLILAGRTHDVALIIGTNGDEGSIYVRPDAGRAAITAQLARGIRSGAEKLLGPAGADDTGLVAAAREVWTDANYVLGARELARSTAARNDNVYQYEFTRVSGAGERYGIGAFHAADVPYWFRNLPNIAYLGGRISVLKPDDYTDIDSRVSLEMSSALLNFLRSGDPNGPGAPVWPEFRVGDESYLEFAAEGARPGKNLHKKGVDAVRAEFLEIYAGRSAEPALLP